MPGIRAHREIREERIVMDKTLREPSGPMTALLVRCWNFLARVRVRLTLWYLAIVMVVLLVFGGSLYSAQEHMNATKVDTELDGLLRRDALQLTDAYREAVVRRVAFERMLASKNVRLPESEVVVVLDQRGTILYTAGPLSNRAILTLQALASRGHMTLNCMLPDVPRAQGDYHISISPVPEQNVTLLVGLPREKILQENQELLLILLLHGSGILLVSAAGGYWLAGKALKPVQLITRTANTISETDLQRRLSLQSNDEFGELAATFNRMLDRLEEGFQRQKRFTADASHELRTPLTLLLLEIHRGLTALEKPEEYRQLLYQLQEEAEQMSTLVDDLLMLARADAGQITLQREPVDLSDVLVTAIERLLPFARQHEITLATGSLPELYVLGDQQHLVRMCLNLMTNGIKYTSGTGSRVMVSLEEGMPGEEALKERFLQGNALKGREAKEPIREGDVLKERELQGGELQGWGEEETGSLLRGGMANRSLLSGCSDENATRDREAQQPVGWACICIQDDGPGIAPEHLPSLFERFYRADVARTRHSKAGGIGLGLSIVRWIVQEHRGCIEIESQPGCGSTFRVWLPVVASHQDL